MHLVAHSAHKMAGRARDCSVLRNTKKKWGPPWGTARCEPYVAAQAESSALQERYKNIQTWGVAPLTKIKIDFLRKHFRVRMRRFHQAAQLDGPCKAGLFPLARHVRELVIHSKKLTY